MDYRSALVMERVAARRSLLADLLRELGLSVVVEATCPDQALECLGLTVFDMVFIEVNSACDDRFSLIRNLRADRTRDNRVPIIVISEMSHRGLVERVRDIGANGFLAKPFSRGAVQLQIVRISNDRRQFIDAERFAGPDRRRWRDPFYQGPERRCDALMEVHID